MINNGNSTSYYACIAMDLVKSERYTNKLKILKRLEKLKSILNIRFEKFLIVPFDIRRGDEIIGVTSSFASSVKIYDVVRRYCHNNGIRIKFGVGLGTLDTEENTNLDLINGSAVIKAFRALEDINENKELTQYKDGINFYANALKGIPVKGVNALVFAIYNEYNGKSEKQQEAVRLIDAFPSKTYEELGERMGYEENARENFSKLLARADYETYKVLKKALRQSLSEMQNLIEGKGLL